MLSAIQAVGRTAPVSSHIFNLEWSPDGSMLCTVCEDNLLRLYDYRVGKCVGRLSGHSDAVNVARFVDDRTVLTGSDDCTIKMWDVRTMRCAKSFVGHRGWVKNVEQLSDRVILSAGFDGTVRWWDLKRDYETAARSVEFDPVGGPQWAMANPGNVVGLPPAAPLLRPPLTLVRLPQLFHHRRLRRIRVSPDRRTVVAAVGRMVCVLSAFDMDHVRADLGQRDLEALLSAQVQQSDAATVARSQCSSPSARDDGRGEPGREGLSACAADSSAAGPSSPSSLPPPSAVPTKARMRQHNRLSDATARQAAFLGLARDLDSECEAWLAQTQAQPGAGAATHPQVLASGAVANAEASDTGDHTAGAAMEGAGVWAGPDLWGGSSASSASSRDSTEPEASWTGPEPGTRREGAAAVAAARRFGGMYWLYASAATARVPSVSGDSGAAVAGDGGASVTATAGSADHSDVASLGWESLRAEEPHWVPGASLLNRNRLEILQEPLQGYTFSLSVRDRRHGADCRLTVPPPQFDASGRYMVTRRVLDDAEDGTEREATCVFDMQAPSLLPAIDPEGAPRGAVNGRDYSMDPDCVYPDRLVGLASDSAAASDLIKGPALSPCGRAVVSPYYNGLRVFSVEQAVQSSPSDPTLAHLVKRRRTSRGLPPPGLPLLTYSLNAHSQPVLTCRFHPRLPIVASAGADGCVVFHEPR